LTTGHLGPQQSIAFVPRCTNTEIEGQIVLGSGWIHGGKEWVYSLKYLNKLGTVVTKVAETQTCLQTMLMFPHLAFLHTVYMLLLEPWII
jgi:hypothetical protein